MESSTTTIDELNRAIETLRDECNKHRSCVDCPLSDNRIICRLRSLFPCAWKTIEEGDSDGSTKAD